MEIKCVSFSPSLPGSSSCSRSVARCLGCLLEAGPPLLVAGGAPEAGIMLTVAVAVLKAPSRASEHVWSLGASGERVQNTQEMGQGRSPHLACCCQWSVGHQGRDMHCVRQSLTYFYPQHTVSGHTRQGEPCCPSCWLRGGEWDALLDCEELLGPLLGHGWVKSRQFLCLSSLVLGKH